MLPSPRLANCVLTLCCLPTRRLHARPKMSAQKLLLGVGLLLNVGNVASFASTPMRDEVMPITMDEVETAQQEWAAAIVAISDVHLAGGDVVDAAETRIEKLYGYGRTPVLFKPTKAAVNPFRAMKEGALSYFVGGDKVPNGGYAEDKGFALGTNGDGWSKVELQDHQVVLNGATAQAMGEYFFTNAQDNTISKVEYTFGYKRTSDGVVRIYLHHSSLPWPMPTPTN
jgi:hypothetical protein